MNGDGDDSMWKIPMLTYSCAEHINGCCVVVRDQYGSERFFFCLPLPLSSSMSCCRLHRWQLAHLFEVFQWPETRSLSPKFSEVGVSVLSRSVHLCQSLCRHFTSSIINKNHLVLFNFYKKRLTSENYKNVLIQLDEPSCSA